MKFFINICNDSPSNFLIWIALLIFLYNEMIVFTIICNIFL